ncbi:hypothetical protein [Lelliottia nimipressuralis]|uniref:Uncharacterized protein n=1 Tax=Lelliottia nimipressuralis TaxID=69220 RepID=A0ABD4KHP5_9ENTR|nr:hypothetical protein [Lelliottia nimipressuralis]MBF4180583.1 hypothetical protein [Lelliottia nimipressuralis]
MTTKTAAARKEQQKQQAEQRKADRNLAVSEEQKSLIRDMRKLGFAPRKGNVTQKHFERYAAYLETQAMANRASALQGEVAVFLARGGLMTRLFDKMESSGIKPTAFANLATTAARLVSLAPTLAEKSRSTLAGQTDAFLTDSDLDAIERDVMKGVSHD